MRTPKLPGEGRPSDRDALAFLLAACKVENAEAFADRLLREFRTLDAAIGYIGTLRLGSTVDAAAACIAELGTSRELHIDRRGRRLDNTEDVGKLLISWFRGCDVEQLLLLCLNDRYRLVDCKVAASGSSIHVRFDPKKLLNDITAPGTKYVILAHNHPATTALPSRQDVKSTTVALRLFHAAGLELLDHIVVYENDFISMRESNLLDLPDELPPNVEFVVRGSRLDYRKLTKK